MPYEETPPEELLEATEKAITLEQFESMYLVSDMDLVALTLVAMGLRPACTVEFTYGTESMEAAQDVQDMADAVKEFCDVHGLETKVQIEEEDDGSTRTTLIVARNEDALEKLEHRLSRSGSIAKLGKTYGFPESAAYAAEVGDLAPLDTLPDAIRTSDWFKFLYFNPSREHWREDLSLLEEQVAALKLRAPELYEKVTGHDAE